MPLARISTNQVQNLLASPRKLHLVCTSYFHAHHGGHASPPDCAATLALLATRPAAFAAAAGEQMQARTTAARAISSHLGVISRAISA